MRRVDKTPKDLNEMFDMFIAEKQRNGRSPETIKSYIESQKRFMAFIDESGLPIMCKDVNEEYIDDYQDYLQEDGGEEGLKPSSVNHYLRETRAFLYWCQDH